MQIGKEVLVMTWTENDNRVTLGEMRIVPSVLYDNIKKGFKYEKVHRP